MHRPPPSQGSPRARARRWATAVAACVALCLAGCDTGNSDPPPPPGAKPGHVSGKLSDARGNPLRNVSVRINGMPEGSGEPFNKTFHIPGPASEYAFALPPGRYDTPQATITADYNGRTYVLQLAAADNSRDWPQSRPSKPGLVRDFVWRIEGPRPEGEGDPLRPTGWWGGAILLDKPDTMTELSTFEITLTPAGPLIDGSPGKPLLFTRRIPWQRPEEHYLLNIPVGKYTASATVAYAGGKPKPMKLVCYTAETADSAEPMAAPQLTAEVEFIPKADRQGRQTLLVPNLLVIPDAAPRR